MPARSRPAGFRSIGGETSRRIVDAPFTGMGSQGLAHFLLFALKPSDR
ncbi:MAG: hypothetical protein ACUVX9_16555 [Anaerolineae bacterium]